MSWYTLHDGNSIFRMEFHQPRTALWTPQTLTACPLPAYDLAARDVLITGRAPTWMYAAVGAWAGQNGARRLGVIRPQDLEPLWFYPEPNGATKHGPSYAELHAWEDRNGCVLVFSGKQTPDEELPSVAARWAQAIEEARPEELLLTGVGSSFHYAAAAAAGARSKCQIIAWHSPIEGASITIVGGLRGLAGQVHSRTGLWLGFDRGCEGHVLGVVGDPNSGKSVLTMVLADAMKQTGQSSWRLDCDLASPTQRWYFSSLATHGPEIAQNLRKGCKRAWSPELIDIATRYLANARRGFDLVVADFPGGRHNADLPQRIPADRERMFREVDSFLVLAREGSDAAVGWLEALDRLGIAGRVSAIVTSHSPDAAPSWELDQSAVPFLGRVSGLERTAFGKGQLQAIAKETIPFLSGLAGGFVKYQESDWLRRGH